MPLTYRYDLRPEAAAIAKLYDSAGLIRPTHDVHRIRRMYAGSNVVFTAWAAGGAEVAPGGEAPRSAVNSREGAETRGPETQGALIQGTAEMLGGGETPGSAADAARLVGILRGWTDGAYDGYVCDLAVHAGYQKQGIGRELLARAAAHYGREVQWVLRASPIAAKYYEHLGWKYVENGWCLPREDWR